MKVTNWIKTGKLCGNVHKFDVEKEKLHHLIPDY
jgi:hypothetical protein